ncbi:uncharacterized protein [Physcomitrium patens]|uniref:uncharacterized protein n=1 Tax=Physcomitrium patens TaxID=3218 RepID=UPI003CCE4592
MTANNVEALLVVKSGTEKMLAGIITERGLSSPQPFLQRQLAMYALISLMKSRHELGFPLGCISFRQVAEPTPSSGTHCTLPMCNISSFTPVKTSRNLVTFDQRVKLMEMIVLYYDDPYLLFMQNKLITVSPDTKVLRAMELMTDNRIRHIPVVEDKKMKGMVSIGDVVRAVLDEHREELQSLNSYIQGGY